MNQYYGEQDSRQVQKLLQLTVHFYEIIVIFIGHLLEASHSGFINIIDDVSILVGASGVVVIVVVHKATLFVFVVSNSRKEEVLGETERGQHREDVEKQTEQSHRRGQREGEGGGTGDEDVGFGRSGKG